MTTRPSTPSLVLACLAAAPTAVGAVLVELAADLAQASEPTWIKLAPAGAVTTRDGRSFIFDAAALAARFRADAIDVPIDINHSAAKGALGGEAPAVGWIKEMEARPDGLYGRVEWLATGKEILAARSHRYLSPTFPHDDTGRATWLHSASLVSAPALPNMPALASAEPATQEQPMKSVLAALGLSEAASEVQALTALTALQAKIVDPSSYVLKTVHDATLAQLSAATTQIDTIKAATRKAEIDALIDGALAAKKILPAQKDHFATLCATDDGFAQVKNLIEVSPAMLGASGLDDKKPGEGQGGTLTEQQLAVCASLGLDPDDYKKQLAAA